MSIHHEVNHPLSGVREGIPVVSRLFAGISLVLTITALVVYLYVAFARLTYSSALEWIEPNSYTHVARILQGLPLYGPPTYDFIPMIYTPFYFYASAAVAWVIHDITLAMRLVSLFASLTTFGLLYSIGTTRGFSRITCMLPVGLFAAAYGITSYWFDISRVDMLFVALLLVAYRLILSNPCSSVGSSAIAGVVLCLAFMTKQQAAVAFPFLAGYLLIQRCWRQALSFGTCFIVTFGVSLLVMHITSDGWFWFYVFTVPGAAPLQPQLQYDFWTTHVLPHFYPALLAIALSVCILVMGKRWIVLRNLLTSISVIGVPMLAMSYLSMSKQWGFVNGIIPLAVAVALVSAEAVHYAITTTRPPHTERFSSFPISLLMSWLTLLLVLGQFLVLRYDVAGAIPSQADKAAVQHTVRLLRDAPQPVFASTVTDLLSIAGQPLHFHPSSLGDLNLAAQSNESVKAMLAPYEAGIYAPLRNGTIRTAVLPKVDWYDWVFKTEKYQCQEMTAEQRVSTLSGARSTLATVCNKRD